MQVIFHLPEQQRLNHTMTRSEWLLMLQIPLAILMLLVLVMVH
ncbi:MAG: methionyl-tRNA formyltransferase [Mariprofundus sp.]